MTEVALGEAAIPVSYKVKSSSLSNKPKGEKEVYVDNVLYMKKVSSVDTVYFLTPKIDFLSIVFPILDPEAQEAQEGIVNLLVGLVKSVDATEFEDDKKPYAPGYTQNIALTDPNSGARIRIQAQPKKPNWSFLRFELNPAKLGVEGLAFFKDKLLDFLLGQWTYADIATKGKVSRVDLACDVINCTISDLVVRTTVPGKSHAYFGIDEEVETIYLGMKGKKNSPQYAYNKRQDLMDKKRNPKYGGIPWTRIEKRIMANRPITKLCDIESNPLEVFQVFYPDLASPPEKPHHWTFFADSCRQRGIEAALDHLPKGLKKAYKQALDSSGDGFWRPNELWAAWPKALEVSGLLDISE